MPESGKPKDPVQAFLLQKYLHFYDQVNDGEISSAKGIFSDPFQGGPLSPSNAKAPAVNLIEKKSKSGSDLTIKLANRRLDSSITKL